MPLIHELVREAHTHWNDAKVLSRTGQELHDRNRIPEAIPVLERALELDPSDIHAWMALGYANLRSFQPEKGVDTLRRGAEVTGSDLVRARVAGFTSDEEEAKRIRADLADSRDPAARADLISQRFYTADDPKAAFAELRALAEAHADDEDVLELWLWTLIGGKNRGKLDDVDVVEVGTPWIEKRITESPDRVSGYWLKAQLHVVQADWDGLLETTARALEHMPDEETLMQLRARAYREKGDDVHAVQWLLRAIGAKPSFAGARVELGKLYEKQGRLDLAEEIFREIPRSYPAYPIGPVSLALFLARREQWDEAEALLIEAWPGLPAWARDSLPQHPEAKTLLERTAVRDALGLAEAAATETA
ncbi:MAG: tetratricopeptide repeat protein [Planctomycetota bacterium]